jgi:hypothetical protein
MRGIVTYVMEQDIDMKDLRVISPADEWLGPESHVPNLGRELRLQNGQGRDIGVIVAGGVLFAAGVALGSLAAMLMTQSRRTR